MATKTATTRGKKKAAAPKKATTKKAAKTITTKSKTKAKTASKKVSAVKTAAKKAPKRIKAIQTKFTKSQIIAHLAERTELDKKQVTLFFDELHQLISAHIAPRACGEITLPIGVKIKRHEKPAQKARKGRNPFTGEEVMIKAKPKRKVVKVQAMKTLKEILES